MMKKWFYSLAGVLGLVLAPVLLVAQTSTVSPVRTFTCGAEQFVSALAGTGTFTCAAGTGGGAGAGLYAQIRGATPTAASTGFGAWVNQGGATVTDAATGISINAPSNSGDSLRCRSKTSPATPYSVKALISLSVVPANFANALVGWYDGTKLQTISLDFNSTYRVQVGSWSTVSNYNVAHFALATSPGSIVWMKIADDGTNVTFSISASGNDGDFISLYTVAKASGYLGAGGYSTIVFCANRNGTSPATSAIATMLSYALGS